MDGDETQRGAPRYPNVRLRQLRGGLHSQEEMAERLGVGLSTYRSWETGRNRPQPRSVRMLCELLGVDERELGFGNEQAADPVSAPHGAAILPDTSATRVPL